MTTNSDAGKQRAIKYLQRSLQLNPMYESEQIVRFRAKALGQAKEKRPAVAAANSSMRAQISNKIDKVRAACWTEPVEPLVKQLKQLPLDDQPDLKRTADRLHVILSSRSRLPALASHKHFDEKFLSCFKQILTLPPRELAVPREQVIASFRNRKLRGRGLKMIALLEKEVPELCQLEQEWLNSLKRQKVNKDLIVSSGSHDSTTDQAVGSASTSSGTNWWVIWIAIVVLIKVIRAVVRSSE